MKKLLQILLPILFISSGEIYLKFFLNLQRQGVVEAVSSVDFLFGLVSWHFFIAMGLILIGGLFWLNALSKFELSYIYPFFALNFLVIVIGSNIILKETLNWNVYCAMIFIISGIICISKSSYSKQQ